MLNPNNSNQEPGSYVDLLRRMTKALQAVKLDDQIIEMIKQAFENELQQQKMVLSRPEKKRLLGQVSKALLAGVLTKMEPEK